MKLSKIIQRQIPAFIRETPAFAVGEKYNRFVAFLVRYYEFLETEFNKIGTVQGSSSESSPTLIEPPVGIPGSPGVPVKAGDYFLVTSSGFFSIGSSEKRKTVYAETGNIIVFSANGASYLRTGESYNLLTDKDVSSNTQLKIILEALVNEVAYNLPKTLTEEQLILQRIKELYTTKGTEEAYKFLFRVLFNREIDFFYPSSSVLRTSDGVWIQNNSLFIRCLVGNPFTMIENQIDVLSVKNKVSVLVTGVEERIFFGGTGFEDLDLGFVREAVQSAVDLGYTSEDVERILELGFTGESYVNLVFEVAIDRYFYGSIKEDDVVVSRDSKGNLFIGQIISTTTKAEVFSGGKNFRVGDIIPVEDDKIDGSGSKVKVSEVGSGGSIVNVDFLTFGYEYSRPVVVSADNKGNVRVIIEERAEDDDDPNFVTRAEFQDFTGGYLSRGYSLSDLDYVFEDGALFNYTINDEGEYNNTAVSVSIAPAPSGGINAQATPILNRLQNNKYELIGLNITNRGSGYLTPPQITVSGSGQVADVDALIGYDLYWDIDYCGVVSSRFVANRSVNIPDEAERALIKLYPGAVAKYPGYYQNNLGFLSDTICLQDGRYYQDFSYVIKSDIEMRNYEGYVKSAVHPSGMALFGEYQVYNVLSIEDNLDISSEFRRTLSINVQDSYSVFDAQTFTDVVYSHTEYVIDNIETTDYGIVVDDPYTLPYLPYASRMWETYTEGDVLIEFGEDITPPPPTVTLDPSYSNALGVLSNGNLSWEWAWVGSYGCSYSTLPRSTGKYYFEIINNVKGGYGGAIYDNWSFNGGISTDRGTGNDTLIGSTATAWGFSNSNSSGLTTDTKLFNNSTAIDLIGVPQIPEGGYLGVAVDFDAGKIWFNANGTWVLNGNPVSGTNPAFTFASNIVAYAGVGQGSRSPFGKSTINFGATAFSGTVPTGFTAWKN